MAKIIGQKIGGGSSILTTPIQVTGLKATGKDGGVALSIDSPTEASYPYLKDYWVVWKKKSEGPIQHPYDGQHMTFAKPPLVTGQDLANLAPGSTVKIMENNQMVQFLVLQNGYPSSGDGNILLLRKDIQSTSALGSNNAYSGSTVDNFLTNDYFLLLNESVRNQIVEVSIPYTVGNGNTTVSTLSRQIFLLSATEMGFPNGTYVNTEGTAIPYFNSNSSRIAYFNSSPTNWWLRTPFFINTGTAVVISGDGTSNNFSTSNPYGVRPAFCLPGTTQVSLEPDSDGDYTLV